MPSALEKDLHDFCDWLYDISPHRLPVTRTALVTCYLIWRGEHAIANGVARYVPVDGHDWHKDGGLALPIHQTPNAPEDESSARN